MSVTLTGLVRISEKSYRWKDLYLKKLLLVNLYPAIRGPSIFLERSGRLKKHCVTRQKKKTNTIATNESSFETRKPSLEFRETSIVYIRHSKGFRETIYFSRNITMTTRTYSESTDQQHLRVKFLGDQKGPTKGFYLEVWKLVSSLSFELSTLNCLYICEGLYLRAIRASHATA